MTSTALKLLALGLMLIDHLAEFIPGIPIWFHWLGRISAPIFIFCMVWGFHYTHNRKVYLTRMYLMGVFMAIMDLICNNVYKNPYCMIVNNIFVTMFLIGVVSWITDIWKQDKKKGMKYVLLFCLYQIGSTILCGLISRLIPMYGMGLFLGALTGNLLLNEGSFIFVFAGVMMYLFKEDHKKLSIFYVLFCLLFFVPTALTGFNAQNLLYSGYQWMMIASLPFMLLYNGKKGKGLKYLFYVFYPVHIFILYWAGNLFF